MAVLMGAGAASAQAQVLFTTAADWGGSNLAPASSPPQSGWAGWGVRSALYGASGTQSMDGSNFETVAFTGPDLDGSTINGLGNYDNNNDPSPGGYGGTGNGTKPLDPNYATLTNNGSQTASWAGQKSPGGSLYVENFQTGTDPITTGEMLAGGTNAGDNAFINALTQNGANRGVLKFSWTLGDGAEATNYLTGQYFVAGFYLQTNNGQLGDGYYGYDLQTSPTSGAYGNADTGDFNAQPGSYTINHGTYFTSYIPYNLTGAKFIGTAGFSFLQMGLVINSSGGYAGHNITIDDVEALPQTTISDEWNNLGNASWGSSTVWDDGTSLPAGNTGTTNTVNVGHVTDIPGAEAGDEAAFDGGTPGSPSTAFINVACTVTLDGNRTIGALDFSNSNSYTLAPGTGGTLVLANVGTLAANITNRGELGASGQGSSIGTHFISAPIQITANGAVINQFSSLDFVNISGNISGPGALTTEGSGTVTLSGVNTYGGGTFSDPGNLLVTSATGLPSGGALTNIGTVTVTAGTKTTPVLLGNVSGSQGILNVGTVGSPAYVRLGTGTGTDTQGVVNIASGSTLDVTNNRLVIPFGTPAADPVASIVAGLTSGAAYNGSSDLWTGTGITTSAPLLINNKIAVVGYLDGNNTYDAQYGTVAANTVIVKYTVAGDAFLENSVGFRDLLTVAQHYQLTGQDFAHGNFYYATNGSVGFSDLLAVAQSYGTSFALSGESSGGNTLALGFSAPATSAVPEPASMTVLAAGAMGMLSRRRRKA